MVHMTSHGSQHEQVTEVTTSLATGKQWLTTNVGCVPRFPVQVVHSGPLLDRLEEVVRDYETQLEEFRRKYRLALRDIDFYKKNWHDTKDELRKARDEADAERKRFKQLEDDVQRIRNERDEYKKLLDSNAVHLELLWSTMGSVQAAIKSRKRKRQKKE
jgi:chromosome segregation ATPase